MKMNFWQALGIVLVIAGGIFYYIKTQKSANAPTNTPSTTQTK